MANQSEVQEKTHFFAEMTVNEALGLHAETALVLASFNIGGCSRCSMKETETIEQVCKSYGIPVKAMLGSLNSLFED